jgi:hypothetical protein
LNIGKSPQRTFVLYLFFGVASGCIEAGASRRTVKDASGNILASRQLISLNTTGKHLGSPDEPLVVLVPDAASAVSV